MPFEKDVMNPDSASSAAAIPARGSPRFKIIISVAIGLLLAAAILLFVRLKSESAKLQQETQLRESTQLRVNELEQDSARQLAQINTLGNDLKTAEGKNTEFQSRVISLEKEQTRLQADLANSQTSQKKAEDRFDAERKLVSELQGQLAEERETQKKLLSHIERLMGEKLSLQEKLVMLEKGGPAPASVTLPEVVVSAGAGNLAAGVLQGSILAVNRRYDFVVFNLGEREGVKTGDRWDVFDEGKKAGEVVVRRVLPSMTVADVDLRQSRGGLQKNYTVTPHE